MPFKTFLRVLQEENKWFGVQIWHIGSDYLRHVTNMWQNCALVNFSARPTKVSVACGFGILGLITICNSTSIQGHQLARFHVTMIIIIHSDDDRGDDDDYCDDDDNI